MFKNDDKYIKKFTPVILQIVSKIYVAKGTLLKLR